MIKFIKEINNMANRYAKCKSVKSLLAYVLFATLFTMCAVGFCMLLLSVFKGIEDLTGIPVLYGFPIFALIFGIGGVGYVNTVSFSFFVCKKDIEEIEKLETVEEKVAKKQIKKRNSKFDKVMDYKKSELFAYMLEVVYLTFLLIPYYFACYELETFVFTLSGSLILNIILSFILFLISAGLFLGLCIYLSIEISYLVYKKDLIKIDNSVEVECENND